MQGGNSAASALLLVFVFQHPAGDCGRCGWSAVVLRKSALEIFLDWNRGRAPGSVPERPGALIIIEDFGYC